MSIQSIGAPQFPSPPPPPSQKATLHKMIKNMGPFELGPDHPFLQDVNKLEDNETPLTLAVGMDDPDRVTYLLSINADPLIPNGDGKCPIDIARGLNNQKIIDLLSTKKRKAESEDPAPNKRIKLSLYDGAAKGDLESVRECIEVDKAPVDKLNQNGYAALHIAALGDHVEVIDYLLQKQANINLKSSPGETALFIAAKNGKLAAVQKLVENGAEVNGESSIVGKAPNGKIGMAKLTALHIAAMNGKIEVVNYLLQKQANINLKSSLGETALFIAVKNGKLAAVQKLVENGAEVNGKNTSEGLTALHVAAAHEYTDMIEYLIEKKATVDVKSNNKSKNNLFVSITPLALAASAGKTKAVEALVKRGANIHEKNGYLDLTALHLAASKGHQNVVVWLLDHNANIEAKATHDQTPLHIASENGQKKIVDLLLTRKAEINAKTTEKETALSLAVLNERLEVVPSLVSQCANVNEKTGYFGETVLHIAASKGLSYLIDLFIKNKADINAKTDANQTPLFLAVSNDRRQAVGILLQSKPDVNAPDRSGKTPLQVAIKNGDTSIFRVLIQNGANREAEGSKKRSPLFLAAYYNNLTFVQMLVEKGVDINKKNGEFGETALHSAAINDRDGETVSYLISHGAEVNAQNDELYTPLHNAATYANLTTVRTLLGKNASTDITNQDGQTPLHIAAQKGCVEIVIELLAQGADASIVDTKGKRAQDLNQSPAIQQLFQSIQQCGDHIEKLKIFDQKVRSDAPWDPTEFFELTSEHLKTSKNRKFLKPESADLFATSSFRYMMPLFSGILLEDPKLQKPLTLRLEETMNKIATAKTVQEAQAYYNPLRASFSCHYKLSSVLFGPELSKTYNEDLHKMYTGPLDKCLRLRKEQQTAAIAKETVEPQTEEEFHTDFASDGIVEILVQLGVGIASHFQGNPVTPTNSYPLFLGVQGTEIAKYGVTTGADLQAIGVDFILKHYHNQFSSTIRSDLAKTIQSKLSLVQAVGVAHPTLVGLLTSLLEELDNPNTDPEVLRKHLNECHKELSLALLKTFFSQQKAQVIQKLNGQSLFQLNPNSKDLNSQIALYNLAPRQTIAF